MHYEYRRCPKCGVKDETGMRIGTIMVRDQISIYHKHKANEPIADIILCAMCGFIGDIFPIRPKDIEGKPLESLAEKHGITVAHIRSLYTKIPSTFYTLRELKAQKASAVIDYDPDAYVESKYATIVEELF